MKTAYSWHPIEDYEVDPGALARPELRELAAVWDEQRDALEQIDGLSVFNEKLNREWAIETGLLERVYTLDRGVTQMAQNKAFVQALSASGGHLVSSRSRAENSDEPCPSRRISSGGKKLR